VTAFVVGRPGDTPENTLTRVTAFIKEQSGLPSLKRPKRVIVVEHIPKSAVGKILRRRLNTGEFTALAQSEEGRAR
jgi:2-furoate---CoA ligase